MNQPYKILYCAQAVKFNDTCTLVSLKVEIDLCWVFVQVIEIKMFDKKIIRRFVFSMQKTDQLRKEIQMSKEWVMTGYAR